LVRRLTRIGEYGDSEICEGVEGGCDEYGEDVTGMESMPVLPVVAGVAEDANEEDDDVCCRGGPDGGGS